MVVVWARYLRMIMLSLLVVGRCQLGHRPGLVCEVSDLEVKGMSDQFIFLEIIEWTLVVFLSLLLKKILHTYTYSSMFTCLLWHFVPFIHIYFSLCFLSVNAHMLACLFLLCLWYMWAFEP